jgi:hypothetical protein
MALAHSSPCHLLSHQTMMSGSDPLTQAKSEAQAEAFGEAIRAVAEKCDHLINQVARG